MLQTVWMEWGKIAFTVKVVICMGVHFCRFKFLRLLFAILDFCSIDAQMYSIDLCVFHFAPNEFTAKIDNS